MTLYASSQRIVRTLRPTGISYHADAIRPETIPRKRVMLMNRTPFDRWYKGSIREDIPIFSAGIPEWNRDLARGRQGPATPPDRSALGQTVRDGDRIGSGNGWHGEER
jgi:hypothetical protein